MNSTLVASVRRALGFAAVAALLSILIPRAASAAASGEAGASAVRLRRFALLIGVNDGGGTRPRLRYAVSDAKSMARVLGNLGGVAASDLVFVSEPSRASILAAFDRMDALVRAGTAPGVRRELLVYYSGHSDEEGLLVQGDRMSYGDLRARLQAVPADVRVAILDSCSSGAFTRRKGGVHRAPFLMDASVDMRGHAILTSSSANEAAQESDRIGGSFFTHFLVSGLRGAADVNSDRRVTLQEAFQFAAQETLARTERTQGGPQHAAYEFDLAGTGELVVTDVRSTPASLVLAAELAGRMSVRDASGDLVAELRKTAGHPVELGLEPGSYVVTMDGSSNLFEAKMTLASGERTQLARLAFHAVGPREIAMARGDAPAGGAGVAPEATAAASAAPPAVLPRRSFHGLLAGVDPEHYDVHGLSLGFVAERVDRVTGLQFALGIAQTDQSLRGIQLSIGANMARGDTRGVQFGSVVSFADGRFRGLQNASAVSIVRGDGAGLQLSGGLNYSQGTWKGTQLAAINVAESARGLQLGAINVANTMTGLQLGAINVAKVSTGFQLSAVNISGESKGFQLSAVNISGHQRGFQLGAINIIDEADGEAFGAITYARNGIHNAVFYTSDTMLTNVAVKLGTRHLYTALGLGFNPGDELSAAGPQQFTRGNERVATNFSVGWRFPLQYARLPYLELEATNSTIRKTFAADGDTPLISSLRLQTALQLAPHLSLVGGLGVNVAVGWSGHDADLGLGVLERVERSGQTTVRIYPGFVLGVQI